jgi:peptidoglycan/xylan/chitin deacetylase (PgdA/CDA1 family)
VPHHRLHTPEALRARRRRARRAVARRRAIVGVAATAALVAGALLATAGGGSAQGPRPPAPDGAARMLEPRATVFPRRAQQRLALLPYVAVGGRAHREIALTFDDGPGPYTLAIVRELKELRAPATFFQVGVTERYFTAAERAELDDPLFAVGDHTLDHRRLDRLSAAGQASQIDAEVALLRAADQPYPRLFRPPYGAYDATTLRLLRERGMTMVMWTLDSQDYLRPGADAIVERVLAGARPGAIVLLHDAGGDRSQTVAALPRIVRALRARHYRLVTIPRLLRDAPPPARQPEMVVGAG